MESQHAPGADVTLICTDTHARLNGYPAWSTERYFEEVGQEAAGRGFWHACSSAISSSGRRGTSTRHARKTRLRRNFWSLLSASAAKWYRGGGSIEEGARRYYAANMIERQAVEAVFPNAVFVSFNGSELRPLFPDRMPIFYMYSVRRGVAVKPWFMAGRARGRRRGPGSGGRSMNARAARTSGLPFRILANGDTAMVVEFGDRIDLAVNARVLALADRIAETPIEGVVETVPTFRSLMIAFDPARLAFSTLADRVSRLLDRGNARPHPGRLWRLPVCYDPEVAPDLPEAAERAGLTAEAFASRHAAITHHVYMLGFLPGQPYLGDLPSELALPRRETPRTRVAAGSVGVAARMTCLFPKESCGTGAFTRNGPEPDPGR